MRGMKRRVKLQRLLYSERVDGVGGSIESKYDVWWKQIAGLSCARVIGRIEVGSRAVMSLCHCGKRWKLFSCILNRW